MSEGASGAQAQGSARLPFSFQASGGVGKLALADLPVGPVIIDRLELEVADLGTDPGITPAERFQRRRTRLRGLSVRMTVAALEERVEQVRKSLAALGLTQLHAKIGDGFVSVRARAADGLAAADLSFRIQFANAGAHLRALATTVRVHGHLPTPGPIIADRILTALFGATDSTGVTERPHTRGLCDVEIDLVGALLWHLMPPHGWRLPAIANIELTSIRIGRAGIEVAYGPVGTRTSELGVRPQLQALAAAHDLMHSVDQQVRDGHLEDAMRGYRALLASNGPDQPLLLERILALASARPAWFFDGLELSRQALGRWPEFAASHAALASITLAQGDAREAANHLTQVAQLASADGDDDQAALAALAGARLLRVLEPKAATRLYELALEHDAGSAEAADSLADRLADEQRWSELVRLVRARAASTTDTSRVVQLRLRLADVFMHHLNDPPSAQQELTAARNLAPDDPSLHEMTASILATSDPAAAVDAWREVARLAEARGDNRTCGRAWATLGDLLASGAHNDTVGITAEIAWQRALEYDAIQTDALAGLARASAKKSEHGAAAKYYERLRGLGLPHVVAARYELELARSLVALTRVDDARASLRRATLAGGETAAEAHAVLAEIAEASSDREHAAAELDTAIDSFVELATDEQEDEDRFYTRAAELAIMRATLFDRNGQASLASQDWQRAHELAHDHAPQLARDAARTMLSRAGEDAAVERRWIDAVLATRPPAPERAGLLVRRAEVRRRERTPDLAAAIADLHEALQLTESSEGTPDEVLLATRRRAYSLEAELLAQSGDQRARAQALSALAKMAERAADRIEVETAAAAAWLAADEPAAALPHGARAIASLEANDRPEIPATLRREVLVTLGEAAWRQRAWPDVTRAYRKLIEDPGSEAPRVGTFRYRLAVAADRSGDAALAVATLKPLVEDSGIALGSELRGQALRLYADLAERAGDLASAARALETFASIAVDGSPSARADATYRAGELFRRAEQFDNAIRCFDEALRISDTHLPALDALEAAWRDRGDLERVAVILGRKVAATARHPARQKPLLSRLGDLHAQLGRPDVGLATHQRALEIDPTWRPSLRYVTLRLREQGQLVAAAGGLAQLSGDLSGDSGVDLANVLRDRQVAAVALAELVMSLDDGQVASVRDVAIPALERAALDASRAHKADASVSDLSIDVTSAIARLKGESIPPKPPTSEEHTPRGRVSQPSIAALSLRDAAARAKAAGKLDEALATLETANHVNPGDTLLLRELVELSTQVADHAAAAKHLAELATLLTGTQRANTLLELADIYFDHLEDPTRGREAMRNAADAFGSGVRRDSTLRLLATEASSNLAWDIAVQALTAIAAEKRTSADIRSLANALVRAGRDADAVRLIEEATGRLDDGDVILEQLRADVDRKSWLAKTLDARAGSAASPDDAEQMRAEAKSLRSSLALRDADHFEDTPPPRTKTDKGLGDRAREPSGSPIAPSDEPTVPAVPLDLPTVRTGSTRIPDSPFDTPTVRGAPSAADWDKLRGGPTSDSPTVPVTPASSRTPTQPRGSSGPVPVITDPDATPIPSAPVDPSRNFGPTDPPDHPRHTSPTVPAPIRSDLVGPQSGAEAQQPRMRENTQPGRSLTPAYTMRLREPARPSQPPPIPEGARRTPTQPPPLPTTAPAPTATPATGVPAMPRTMTPPAGRPTPTGIPITPRAPTPTAGVHVVPRTSTPSGGVPAPRTKTGETPSSGVPVAPTTTGQSGGVPVTLQADQGSPPAAPSAPVGPSAPLGPSRNRVPTPNAVARVKLMRTTQPGVGAAGSGVVEEAGWQSVLDPKVKSGPIPIEESAPSVVITGSESEKQVAVEAAAASADRDRLLTARRENPDDPGVLLALLTHLGDREPALRREVLEETAKTAKGRALAIALHELATLARSAGDASRAAALWARGYEIDPKYAPIWMPLADAYAASDDMDAAGELYEKVANSSVYDASRRNFARGRAAAIGRDDSVVSGEIKPPGHNDLAKARAMAESGDFKGAISIAEKAAERASENDFAALELLETLYLETGDITAASEAIGRQLVHVEDPVQKASLWRRRARIYRNAIGRDAEAYRCLKEAHACSPADPEISYLLRTAAMVRNEWALAASLLYREIAAAATPRERGALHLELALIYQERLDDLDQSQVNLEQALAFDPTIPAAKAPLAKRYEALGRHAEAAKLYEEAATTARPADRASLLASAQRAKTAAESGAHPDLSTQIERAESTGNLDEAIERSKQLWALEPGNPRAFRVLANVHRAAGDLPALTELTNTRIEHAAAASDKASAWLEVARLAEELGELDQAARAYDLALVEDPGHIGALDARGALAFKLGDYTTADLIYKDIEPGESVLGPDELALRRSIIVEKLGRDTEALDLAQIAQAASPARRDIVMRVQELATRMGEIDLAIVAARKVLELIPLDDEEAQLQTHFQLVDLLREAGKLEAAISQLERVRRDHPMHAPALELLAELHSVRNDWPTATRYLYQLVPLAPTPSLRADRLYRLGDAVLNHLGEIDRADDIFLRASDLDPNHLPTLRRLIDVYWRADDPGALVEVAAELAAKDALSGGAASPMTLAHALVAAALVGENTLAERLSTVLGDGAPKHVAGALAELAEQTGQMQLAPASTAIIELGRRGVLDLQKVRAAAAGTPVANVLI